LTFAARGETLPHRRDSGCAPSPEESTVAGYSFEIYKDRKGEFRVRFKARNGETMFSTEGYSAKASAMNAIKSIIKNAGKAAIDDATKAPPKGKAAPAKKKAAPKKKAAAKTKAAPKAKPAPAPAPMPMMGGDGSTN
jgi:hypothetical protein